MTNIKQLENARIISKTYHKWQKYSNQDYFQVHIMDVLDRATKKAHQLRLDKDTIIKIQICVLLHDVLEDTDIDFGYMIDKVWEENARNAYILSIKELDGTKKPKEKYFWEISQNIVTKVTKFGDRKSNMIATHENLHTNRITFDRANKFLTKYTNDMPYRDKFDIFPWHMNAIINKTKAKLLAV